MSYYVVEVTYGGLNAGIIGVYTDLDEAKKISDSILKNNGEYCFVYKFDELNVSDLRESHHKIVYSTTDTEHFTT